ncbi:MAG: hypothetical protein J6F30_13140 [Cellulosilyticum sp.]|nr:hypothetical protein [Cellulosilyticum lentocellum]MBP3888565.1 hypothetical protein [Cellulosilyticum sp.]
MRDVRNLIVELTNSEKDFLIYILDKLIKAKGYKLIVLRDQLVKLGYADKTIRNVIRLLAVAEIIKHHSTGRKQELISVCGIASFYNLIKELGVR